MRIGVLTYGQNFYDKPNHYVSSTMAKLMCLEKRYGQRTGTSVITAVEVRKGLIRLQTTEPIHEVKNRLRKECIEIVKLKKSQYIPEELPSLELPGVMFRQPITAAWRQYHPVEVLSDEIKVAEYQSLLTT